VTECHYLTQADNFWVGAKVWCSSGAAWIAQTSTIISSFQANHSITFNPFYITGSTYYDPKAGNKYFIYGKRSLFDTSSEWFYDSTTSTMYLWAPGGVDPDNLQVKVKSSYADTNYGSSNVLYMRDSASPNTYKSFIKFDLSGITETSCNSASLVIRGHNKDSGTNAVKIYAVSNDSWTESTLTWNNMPSNGSEVFSGSVTDTYYWYTFDITSLVNSELSGDKTKG
jgi:hypothetical protein